MLGRGSVYRGSVFSTYNPFVLWAQKTQGSKGNAPGFTNEFQFPEGASTNTNYEYIDGTFDGGRAIPQIATQEKLLMGNYQSMVPDIPFDEGAHEKQKKSLMMMGFAALTVGAFLLCKHR